MERVVSSSVGNENAGALRERIFLGQTIDLRFEREGVFGVRAGEILGEVDAIAGTDFADAVADGFDDAGAIGAGRVRELRKDCVVAGTRVSVGGIDACSVDLDEDLSGGGLGRGDFFELENFRTAKFVDANGFHGYPRR
jgi:hypothetical protein